MNITNKTVLITGGGSGIGFEIAKALIAKNNKVIITGRSVDRLKAAAEKLGNVSYLATDINSEADVDRLVAHVEVTFGGLDVLINNAGQAYLFDLTGADAYDKAVHEFSTNFFAIIRLTNKLLPLLKASNDAAIVNVSSVVSYVPGSAIATYSASKAALHSYTQSLRFLLAKDTSIKIFELMPPLVDTDFSAEIGGANGIPPKQVADEFIAAVENDEYEIRVGNTAGLYQLFLSSPDEAFAAMNQRADVSVH